jgi:hypothetical protein
MSISKALVVLLLITFASSFCAAWNTTAVTNIANYTGEAKFGGAIALTNNYAIVGACNGHGSCANKAFIFERTNGVWSDQSSAVIDGYTSESDFGNSVGLTDKFAIVGAFGAKKAFIFANSNGVWSTTAVATINGYTGENQFGWSVSMTDKYAIVGACAGHGACANKAFIFENTNGIWSTTAVAEIANYTDETGFGWSVAMTNKYAIVGASSVSKAFIFENTNGIWSTTAVAEIANYTGETGFGYCVAMTSKYAIVGASSVKKAFIFKNTNGIWSTTAVAKIANYTDDGLGLSVAISDNYATVGAATAKAFIFHISNGVWNTTAVATIDGFTSEGGFGYSISMTDTYATVGAVIAKKAFIFANTAETTTAEAPTTTPTTTIGNSTSTSPNILSVGTHHLPAYLSFFVILLGFLFAR